MGERAEYMEQGRACRDTVMLVYIQSYQDCVPRGMFLTLPYGEHYEFCGLDQMLLIMEDIMDAASGPVHAARYRYLYKEPFVFRESGYPLTELKPGEALKLSGRRATFTVQVNYRQHRSMQGKLTARIGRRYEKISFRSSLELIRLLHEYLRNETLCPTGSTGNRR